MAERGEFGHCNAELVVNAEPELASASSKDGDIAFHYKLPDDDLALRSVCISNGVPILSFGASPKVPTITEEDVATIFRLVSEGKRPEFFYLQFPSTHPMNGCRFFMEYSPAWLRWTAVGKLLAEADWTMKCLHVGTRANKEKSTFKSWSAESQLDGLASRLDFPEDGVGPSIMMTCDHVTVQKDEDEIVFPEEPEMKITDGFSSVYSKYITENYPSVAYYDEPLLLKMQELMKLIVAVEWLYKEKGVRPNQDWIMQHTSKQRKAENHHKPAGKRNKPPHDMIPKPTVFKRPTSDVTVKTREALQYETLKTDCEVKRQYGYFDFIASQILMFEEDGTPCPPEECFKVFFKHQLKWHLPSPEPDEPLELLPKNAQHEITSLVPASDTKVEDLTDVCQMKLVVTTTISTHNPCQHYTDEKPQMPIPGLCGAIVPDVESWDELITELSVPIPRIRHHPYIGIGKPMNSGGVSSNGFRVREEPMQTREAYQETQRMGNFQRSGPLLGVHAERIRDQGMYVWITMHMHVEKSTAFYESKILWGEGRGDGLISEELSPPLDLYTLIVSQEKFGWSVVSLLNLLGCQEVSLAAGPRGLPLQLRLCLPSPIPTSSKNGRSTSRPLGVTTAWSTIIMEQHWPVILQLHKCSALMAIAVSAAFLAPAWTLSISEEISIFNDSVVASTSPQTPRSVTTTPRVLMGTEPCFCVMFSQDKSIFW